MAGTARESNRGKRLREISSQEDSAKKNKMRPQSQEQAASSQGKGANDDQAREELRMEYQGLQARARNYLKKDELGLGKHHFEELVDEVKQLCTKASRPREQLQDAELLDTLSVSLKNEARKLLQHQGRSISDFLNGIIRKYGRPGTHSSGDGDEIQGTDIDWTTFGYTDAIPRLRPAISFGTMLGPLTAEAPKARQVSQRRRRDDTTGETVVPLEADAQAQRDDREMEQQTEARARNLFKVIKKAKPGTGGVPVLRNVIDPKSFSKTVENAFALSFLVKDGRCQLNPGRPERSSSLLDMMLAEPKTPPTEAERAAGNIENAQFILSFNYDDWLELRKEFGDVGEPDSDGES